MARLRLWHWGRRQIARLPPWARVAFGLFLVWPCIVVPRWRLFLVLGVLTAAGLSAARHHYQMEDDLDWGTIAALSTSHIWFPLVVLGPLAFPYTLLGGLLVLVADWHRRRVGRANSASGSAGGPVAK